MAVKPTDRWVEESVQGNAVSARRLAQVHHWGYEKVGGMKAGDVDRLMEHAGAIGNGQENRQIGDFYHYEMQDDRAQLFYENAAAKALELALQSDANAQYELSYLYAFGKGVEQSDEKACFWCQAAAANGHAEAAQMMRDFWQDGGVLPVSDTRALAYEKKTRSTDADVKALRKAAVDKQAAEQLLCSVDTRAQKVKKYKLTDLSKTLAGRVINPIVSTVGILGGVAGVLYAIASVAVFVISFFTGYHVTGELNWFNRMFHLLLQIPFRAFSSWFMSIPKAEVTAEFMSSNFSYSEGFLVIPLLKLALSIIIILVWFGVLALAGVILVWLLSTLMQSGIRLGVASAQDVVSRDVLENTLHRADSTIKDLQGKYPAIAGYSGAALLAVCDIAEFEDMDLSSAARHYASMGTSKRSGSLEIKVELEELDNPRMKLYFVLRRIIMMPYVPLPKVNIALDSAFTQGYIAYRKGEDFKKAEKMLNTAMEAEASDPVQAAWAAWVLSRICKKEHQVLQFVSPHGHITNKYKEQNEQEMQRARTLEEKAIDGGCHMIADSEEKLHMLLWACDVDALRQMAQICGEKYPAVGCFFEQMAIAEGKFMQECGAPLGEDSWNEYELKPVWDQFFECVREEANIQIEFEKRGGYEIERKSPHTYAMEARTALRKKVLRIQDKGVYAVDELMDHINDELEGSHAWIRHYDKEAEYKRQAREYAINRQLEAFDERADSVERLINSYTGQGMFTNMERSLMGTMSSQDYWTSDSLRYNARERVRRQAEAEYDASHRDN